MKLFDTHIHSNYSFDGHDSIDKICQSAIQKSLNSIVLTEHYDIDFIDANILPDVDWDKYKLELDTAKDKYQNKLEIGWGIELGQPIYKPQLTNELVNKYKFDFILGSIHNLENKNDYCNFDYSNYTTSDIDALMNDYFDNLCRLAETKYINVITHSSYPTRYLHRFGKDVDLLRYKERYEQLFDTIIKNDLALEYNLSGLRKNYVPSPTLDVISLYYKMGGRKIAVGSDAHFAKDVGEDVEIAYNELKQIGFKYITAYKNSQITQVTI